MAELFKGVESIDMECRQYAWEYGRREVFELFRRFNGRGHRCMLVTSLPEELCEEFANITSMISVPYHMFVASQVLTCPQALIGDDSLKKLHLVDRNSRKEIGLAVIEILLEHQCKHQFHGWEDVLVVGNSLTDIPLGKAVQEKGGRFIAFHPKDTDIMKVADRTYGDTCTLERAFRYERLLVN